MEDGGTTMLVQFVLSLFGGAYLFYSWRQRKVVALIAGTVLSILPFAVSGWLLPLLIAIPCLLLPWFIRQ